MDLLFAGIFIYHSSPPAHRRRENEGGRTIFFRKPTIEDGSDIWKLAKDSEILDLNSAYCYLLLCKHFSETCVVAESGGRLAGFVTAFRPPASPDVLFIWQIGVAGAMRRQGLGRALLKDLLRREASRGVSFLETTITPSNHPSKALFASLARSLNTPYVEEKGFPESLFPEGNHQAEDLIRVGPFDPLKLD
ncbi:diaminobutyrate acetyltransferase [Candidatus Manganitrophus noduliformans]|uniref:L-2,4-diaminobutyric acid acetyltransferase n=1 Tax=Candidatus Manganitrophus noduliformans TaxID=2606439 RepID=A0A7X6I9C6_9BACT|nr:diaminobutyrate acetyltransferase [Candidatus Manganitrophus noduliformans]NKE69261.1 diaminobutyrate acetyltransferase [Candidatus Manganitrophus noduliformans]